MEQTRGDSVTNSHAENEREVHIATELGSIESERGLDGGGRRSRVWPFSSREMESLVALCDTFLPSIDASNNTADDDSITTFYRTSAFMAGTPERVKELITERMHHPKLLSMRLSLWLLSTWIGTFIFCGRASLGSHFPYFQKFSKISQKKREEIVRSWSNSFFSRLRMFFLAMKLISLLAFFTQVNDQGENHSWKAIGYCGPDPDFKAQIQKIKPSNGIVSVHPRPDRSRKEEERNVGEEEERNVGEEEELFGPLYKGIVNLNNPRQTVAETLQRSGFGVSTPHQKVTKPNSSFNPSLILKCDAVVVGSGSGGGVIAGVLANAGYKVLVLEQGNYYARSNLSLLEGPTMDRMYLGSGLIATDDMGVVLLAGATVGGGSAINWSGSFRTPKHVLKEWSEEHELELFDSRLYKEALDVVCEKMGVQFDVENEGFNNAVLRKGCEELGYPVSNIPRNSTANHDCGWCHFGCKDGRKKGTLETWLVDLVNSGNGAILPLCRVTKVLHKRKKGRGKSTATGVAFEFQYNGATEVCVVQSKITVVACGALRTPPLLKKSGLKNPNIGKNLHLHPTTMAWGYFPDSPSPDTWPIPEKKSYEGGIMTAMSTVVTNCDKSGYGAVIQTPPLHPGMFSVLMPWVSGIDIKMRMSKFSRTAHLYALARDKGSGEVASTSSISYRLDRIDEENLQRGLEKLLRILAAAGAEKIGTHHRNGKVLDVKRASSREFERFVKEESSRGLTELLMPICSSHQMGTCRMGVEQKGSAVAPTGETWEVEGLYVADSSVFPTALGVNPMVTIQAIAYCTAQSVLEVLKRKKSK